MKAQGGTEVYLYSLRSALDGGRCLTPRTGSFHPGNDPVPVTQEVGWATVPVLMGVENLVYTGIRFPDRPARRQSLNVLRHPGPPFFIRSLPLAFTPQLLTRK